MANPKTRRYDTDEEYVWTFNTLEPVVHLPTKLNSESFENISQHPSIFIVNTSSVGSRVSTHPVQNKRWKIDVDLTTEQMYILLSFLTEGAFWFYPDADDDEGYLVTCFPNDIRPTPLDSGRWLFDCEFIQVGREIAPTDTMTIPIEEETLPHTQQEFIVSGLSYVFSDRFDREALFTFPVSETPVSDWSLLNLHKIRHETNYSDRHNRLVFNWVRKVKRLFYFEFEGVDREFVQMLSNFISFRQGKFYTSIKPNVNRGIYSSTTTYNRGDELTYNDVRYVSLSSTNLGNTPGTNEERWIEVQDGIQVFPPTMPYIEVTAIEKELEIEAHRGDYYTSITLEEI